MRDCDKRERQIRCGFVVLILLVSVVGYEPGLSDERSPRGAIAGARDAVGTRADAGITQLAVAASPASPTPNPVRPLAVPEALAKELVSCSSFHVCPGSEEAVITTSHRERDV